MPSSARLEIHVIDVSQGDSVVVVNRDLDAVRAAIVAKGGLTVPTDPIDYLPYAVANDVPLAGTVVKSLLIDAGVRSTGAKVVTYLKTIGVLPAADKGYVPELTLMLSHYHDDHGNGLESLLFRKKTVLVTKTVGKKTKTEEKEVNREVFRAGAVYRAEPKDSNKTSKLFTTSAALARQTDGKYPTATSVFLLGQGGVVKGKSVPETFTLGQGEGGLDITVRILAAAQGVWVPGTGVQKVKGGKKVDQNDRSVAVVVQYGSFLFYSAGDIAGNGGDEGGNVGDNTAGASGDATSSHADVEHFLGPAVQTAFPATGTPTAGAAKFRKAGQVTVMKASHHGSDSSTDVYTLAELRPAVVVVSSGVIKTFHYHPTPAFLNRVSKDATADWFLRPEGDKKREVPPLTTPNTVQGTYITEVAKTVVPKDGVAKTFAPDRKNALIVGDIVVRPTDESVLAVQAAAGWGTSKLVVQVYGNGYQTTLSDGELLPVDVSAGPLPPGPATYPIGVYSHDIEY